MRGAIKRLLLAGAAYLAFGKATGLWIPCLFHLATGLYCPGCGITRMMLSLSRLDFAGAMRCNPPAFLALPVLAVLACQIGIRYMKTGSTRLSRRQNRVVWALAACFLIFGIVRNVPALAMLRPPA